MAYKLKLDCPFYYESFDSDTKYLQHISNIESAKDLATKLEYFNKNICSLSIYDIDGKIYFSVESGREIKIYCSCVNCKKAGLYNAEDEKVYLNIRDKELKRIVKNINQKNTYKEKTKYLLTVLGYGFDRLCVYENENKELLNLIPKTKAQIVDFNELITNAFNKKYFSEEGFTENYKCFRFDVEKEILDKALLNALDPHLIIANLQKQIETHYRYPETIVEKPLENNFTVTEINKQLKQLGINDTNFFKQMACDLDVDLNKDKLSYPTLKRYHNTKEVFKFYKYLRGWNDNKIAIKNGTKNICNVPYIGEIVGVNPNICKEIKQSFYSLVPQPISKEEVQSFYVGKLYEYNSPYKNCVYGAYLTTPIWELLEFKMDNVNDKTGYYKDYEREKVFESLKEYAKGFQYGFDNFQNNKVNNKMKLSNNENHKAQTIIDYLAISFPCGLSETKGGKKDVFSGWYNDGIDAGYYYCAWYLIFENHKIFEPYFKKEIPKNAKEKNKLTAPTIALFCYLINESGVLLKNENETVLTYCKRVCSKYKIQFTDKVRQAFSNSSNARNANKVCELILPNIDVSTSDIIKEYLNKKQLLKHNLYA